MVTPADNLDYAISHAAIIAATAREITACSKLPFFSRIRGFRLDTDDLPGSICVWVKYGYDYERLRCEANTQYYANAGLAKQDEDTRQRIYIPKVYDFVETDIDGLPYGIIVMEHVTGVPISGIVRQLKHSMEDAGNMEVVYSFKNRIADAICFLLSLKAPPDTGPGPVGGGRITNFIFGRDDPDAPQDFADLEELQKYVNEENKKIRPELPFADLLSEGLKLCYCDLNFDNFLIADPTNLSSRITLIDFEYANFLPYSFLIWELWNKGESYLEECIQSRCRLEVHHENVSALDWLRVQRAWTPGIPAIPQKPRTANGKDSGDER